ncbi:MAG: universal stress protein [Candidatus Tenebribacter davisii]|jgi:nucleotide-binding universal stress UspA family protein|nr:universal stress protein [Candidatus Tenebribacter davisii]
MKRILVAIDLMDETDQLIDAAKQLVKQFDGELCIIHSESIENYLMSNEFANYPSIEIPKMIDIRKKSIEVQLEKIKEQLTKEGIKTLYILMDGTTTENILREALEFKADLIIVGSHKHGRFYHLLFGSLHDMLISKSSIPIMVIPPKEKN